MFSLSKNHSIQVSKVAVLHNFEYIVMSTPRFVHQRMRSTKEVVKLIKKQ